MTEIWRRIPSLVGYTASSEGRIRNPMGRVLGGTIDRYGYRYFNVSEGRKVKCHQLVCEAFHGPRPEGMEVSHLNGKSIDNRAENLAWMTHRDNVALQKVHGTFCTLRMTGENHPRAKLDERQVARIRENKGAKSHRQLARQFGVSQSTITRILNGQRWATEPASRLGHPVSVTIVGEAL